MTNKPTLLDKRMSLAESVSILGIPQEWLLANGITEGTTLREVLEIAKKYERPNDEHERMRRLRAER